MSSVIRNPVKIALRKSLKESFKKLNAEERNEQSKIITQKVGRFRINILSQIIDLVSWFQILDSPAFKESKRVSIYLSLEGEVNTQDILREMFQLNKEVKS